MIESDVYSMNTRELWNLFKRSVADTEQKFEVEIYKVKQGINIHIPIWYITEDWYTLYPENKRVSIRGYGKYEINAFMEEIDAREDIMREIIIETNEIEESEEPRT